MHLQKIKTWLFRPQNDMRPISWIIGSVIILLIVAMMFFGPIIYIETNTALPNQITMAISTTIFLLTFLLLIFAGPLIFEAIDVVFDIGHLIKKGREP